MIKLYKYRILFCFFVNFCNVKRTFLARLQFLLSKLFTEFAHAYALETTDKG